MLDIIKISEHADNIFSFETFELCLSKENDCCVSSEEGHCTFKSLDEFIIKDNNVFIKQEEDIVQMDIEEFEQIKELYEKFIKN